MSTSRTATQSSALLAAKDSSDEYRLLIDGFITLKMGSNVERYQAWRASFKDLEKSCTTLHETYMGDEDTTKSKKSTKSISYRPPNSLAYQELDEGTDDIEYLKSALRRAEAIWATIADMQDPMQVDDLAAHRGSRQFAGKPETRPKRIGGIDRRHSSHVISGLSDWERTQISLEGLRWLLAEMNKDLRHEREVVESQV